MQRVILAIGTLLFTFGAQAQIDHGGSPESWSTQRSIAAPTYYTTASIDRERMAQEDLVTDRYKETNYRFGVEHEVDIDFFEHASHVMGDDEQSIYRLGIECPEAVTVNFLMDDFYLPEGASMYVYGPESHEMKGAFTSENNRENRIFPVGLIGGSRLVIEYTGPAAGASLHISQITHGYRGVLGYLDANKGPFGNSGPCNINVNCPEGLPYSNLKKSVGLVLLGGFICSGSLVNNVEEDETPLFLTANHCEGNPSNWVVYFNHESTTCSGNTGPINQTVSGAELLASSSNSDFKLVELISNVPASYQPCFGGFDGSDVQSASSGVGIHHPSGDVKKICFEEDPPFHQTIDFNNNPNTNMWMINEWELGVTEGGSSGSPLFNQFGHIIGVLSGGAAACDGTVNNGLYDFYGRIGFSWDGTSASNRLRDHLDPMNTTINTMDTYCPYEDPSSIFEQENAADFKLYPNPASSSIEITLAESIGAYEVRVINALGEVVLQDRSSGQLQVRLDVSDLASGAYMVQVTNATVSNTRPFIKK